MDTPIGARMRRKHPGVSHHPNSPGLEPGVEGLFAGGSVHRFQKTKGIGHGLRDCTSVFLGSAPSPSHRFTIEVVGASAKRVDADGEIVISPPEPVEDASSYDNAVTLEASIGSLLFVSEWADFMYCTAAHPGSSSSSYLYDLDKREQVPFPTKPDIEALLSSARALPKETSRSCLEIAVAEGSGDKPSLDGLYLDFALPRWTPKRGLHTELGFGIMRSYVEGLKTCRLEVAGLPPSLQAERVPPAFAELPRTLGRFEVLGWSLVPPGDEATAALERAFLRKGKQIPARRAPRLRE
jgi:hypothetical protein